MKELFGWTARQDDTAQERIPEDCLHTKLGVYDWSQLDTCFIDKMSSSELSEVINSTYRWYEDAAILLSLSVRRQGRQFWQRFARNQANTGLVLSEMDPPGTHRTAIRRSLRCQLEDHRRETLRECREKEADQPILNGNLVDIGHIRRAMPAHGCSARYP